MNIQKVIPAAFLSLLITVLFSIAGNTYAQTKGKPSKEKDYCMMKDGKMMHMKNGKMVAMGQNMTMKNGIKCMTNGECVMKDGTKMKMKEGECIDMHGHMAKSQKELHAKAEMEDDKKEDEKMESMAMYSCPMHPEITSDKHGKCSKCGMALVKKD